MNSVLTTALKKLPKAKNKGDIRFYWRIILEKFRSHEGQIIAALNALQGSLDYGDHEEDVAKVACVKRMYAILNAMPELTCDIAIRLWIKISGIVEILPMFPSTYHRKFEELSLLEQFTLLEELSQENLDENDYSYLGSLLGLIKVADNLKPLTDRLKGSDLSKKEMMSFLVVIQYMSKR